MSQRARSSCQFSLSVDEDGSIDPNERYSYVDGRKAIYCWSYIKSVKTHTYFKLLLQRLGSGENLLIIEVDGPHQESSKYYTDMYGWPADTIDKGTIEATPQNLKVLINDTTHPFGHGYALSMALLGNAAQNYIYQN